jgi:hypothetical protein
MVKTGAIIRDKEPVVLLEKPTALKVSKNDNY